MRNETSLQLQLKTKAKLLQVTDKTTKYTHLPAIKPYLMPSKSFNRKFSSSLFKILKYLITWQIESVPQSMNIALLQYRLRIINIFIP